MDTVRMIEVLKNLTSSGLYFAGYVHTRISLRFLSSLDPSTNDFATLIDLPFNMSKDVKSGDRIVLSYHDSLLREADVDLLRGPHWINDTLIGFYFEYLDNEAANQTKNLLFVSPEFTQLLKLTPPSDYDPLLQSIDAKSRSFIFFPLNNCESRYSAGGTHWSLLVYSQHEQICFHIDSSKGFNAEIARQFSRNILDCLCGKGLGKYQEISCPQQENGYDCGIYVICAADLITQHVIAMSEVRSCKFDNLRQLVRSKRSETLDLILRLCDT